MMCGLDASGFAKQVVHKRLPQLARRQPRGARLSSCTSGSAGTGSCTGTKSGVCKTPGDSGSLPAQHLLSSLGAVEQQHGQRALWAAAEPADLPRQGGFQRTVAVGFKWQTPHHQADMAGPSCNLSP